MNQGDHVANVISCTAEQRRLWKLDIEPLAITNELCRIEVSHLTGRFVLGTGGFFDFVLAAVLIGGHVTDISDVHHVPNIEAIEAKRAFERIDEQIGPHIAQVLRQIYGRSTGVISNLGRVSRPEFLDTSAKRIKDIKWFHKSL